MPRPRQFDPDAVLDAAARVFHARGYEGTSVQDLADATGLSRSSLYGTWGDKHGLFLAALDRYAEAGRAGASALCDGRPALDAVRAVVGQAMEPGDAPGCLLVNAAGERAATCPDTAQRAAAARGAMTARFEGLVRRAQAEGSVAADRDPARLALLLTGVVFGLRALQTAGATADEMAAVRDGALAALEGR